MITWPIPHAVYTVDIGDGLMNFRDIQVYTTGSDGKTLMWMILVLTCLILCEEKSLFTAVLHLGSLLNCLFTSFLCFLAIFV